MDIFKFNDTPDLGGVIEEVKPFCLLTKNMPVPSYRYVVGDYDEASLFPGLAGNKWSKLCGFSFKPKGNKPLFLIVFCPKLNSSIVRNICALSGWYCWTAIADNNKKVTSIKDIAKKYGFNVNKFFWSDMFNNMLPKFRSNVMYAIENLLKTLIKKMSDSTKLPLLKRIVAAIKNSLGDIDEVKETVREQINLLDQHYGKEASGAPNIGDRKLAYNANKTYTLPDNYVSGNGSKDKAADIDKDSDIKDASDDNDKATPIDPHSFFKH